MSSLRDFSKVKVLGILLFSVAIIALAALAASTATAETLNPDKVYVGEAYQVDNYVIEIDAVDDLSRFINGTWKDVYINVYKIQQDGTLKQIKNPDANKRGDKEGRWLLRERTDREKSVIESVTIEDGVDNSSIELEYVDAQNGVWAQLVVQPSWQSKYTKQIESKSSAKFLGRPNLVVTKKVDMEEVNQGQMVTVTVNAKNVGTVKATDISIRDPTNEGFVVEEYFMDEAAAPSSIGVGETKTLMRYRLKADGAGMKTLSQTRVSYKRTIDGASYSTTSTSPSVEIIPVKAHLNASLSLLTDKIETGGTVKSKILLESTGDLPVKGTVIRVNYPEGAKFEKLVDEDPVDEGGPELKTLSGGKIQITLNEAIEPGVQREIITQYSFQEPSSYEFKGEVLFDPGNDISQKKIKKSLDEASVTVESSTSYWLTHLPMYVYATPVVIILSILGYVWYVRRQYQF